MKFYKDFGKDPLEKKDMFDVFGVEESGEEIPMASEKDAAINRAVMKAFLMAEEIKGAISVERDEKGLKITVCKDFE